jgi:hypothetical protein
MEHWLVQTDLLTKGHCQLKALPAVVTEREPVAPLARPTPTVVELLHFAETKEKKY